MDPLDRATRRVLELAARGLTTAEIADRLDVRPEQVRERLGQAMAALGASSKLEAIIIAMRAGLITLVP